MYFERYALLPVIVFQVQICIIQCCGPLDILFFDFGKVLPCKCVVNSYISSIWKLNERPCYRKTRPLSQFIKDKYGHMMKLVLLVFDILWRIFLLIFIHYVLKLLSRFNLYPCALTLVPKFFLQFACTFR